MDSAAQQTLNASELTTFLALTDIPVDSSFKSETFAVTCVRKVSILYWLMDR